MSRRWLSATGVTVSLSWLIPGRKAWLTAQTRNSCKNAAYLCSTLKAFDFCIPTRGTKVPGRLFVAGEDVVFL
jgi:hypothetical protein